MLVLGGLAVASLEKQRNKRSKNAEADKTSDATPYDKNCLVPALPFESDLVSPHDSMEQGQASHQNEYRPLVNMKGNSGPERRR